MCTVRSNYVQQLTATTKNYYYINKNMLQPDGQHDSRLCSLKIKRLT